MNIYQSIYDLLNTYIFGGLVQTGTYQELACILASMCLCLFCFSIPFIVVWSVIKLVTRW